MPNKALYTRKFIIFMTENYEAIIGLEVHAQLLTATKAFCGCSTSYSLSPNAHTCPVCLGLPGALPVLNERVVEFAVKMGLATNCSIRPYSTFSRKNYFYADLPKGYQISQYEDPICYSGHIAIETGDSGETKNIGITRIHMEEDSGKSIHDVDIDTLVDLNRSGVPLIEIVSGPDMRTAREAYQYLNQIRQIVMYLGICDGNLEEGSLRCDANISVRKKGAAQFGTKVEIKNLNSFRNVEKAIDFEIKRQIQALESGEIIVQETRMWDAGSQQTKVMRTKEFAHDYRYFPEPDLGGVIVSDEMLTAIRNSMPELPLARKRRFVEQYGLPWYDSGILTETQELGAYFEDCCAALKEQTKERYKLVSNWIMTEVLRYLSEQGITVKEFPVTPMNIAELVELFASEVISSKIAKEIFPDVINGETPKGVVEKKGLLQISDEGLIVQVVEKVLDEQTDNVTKYREGKKNLFGHFVSSVLKELGGKANPRIVTKLLQERLN